LRQSIDSATSSACPTARPSGCSIEVWKAVTATPVRAARSHITRASSAPRSGSGRNAPLPYFTSSTSAPIPSASFFDRIDEAISGIDSTSPAASRSAYSLRSAGAISAVCPTSASPRRSTAARISARVRSVRKPGIDSSLSSVPPVCARPRPEIIGTATPQAATAGASGIEALSPTPPVECLSPTGRPSPSNDSRSPDSSMPRVQASSSPALIPWMKIAVRSAAAW
jgi:hypothetical protein